MKRFLFALLAALVISITGMGTSNTTATASANGSFDSLYSTARSYLGVPYRLGGTTRNGIDCSAFTQVVFKQNGVSIPRTTGQQFSTGTSVAKSNLQNGDLVFFNTMGRGVSHVGIYVGNNNFIHASTSRGVMISSIYDPYYWGSRYIGAKRVKNFSAPVKPAAPKPEVVKPKPDPKLHLNRVEVAVVLTEELGLTADSNAVDFNDISNTHPEIVSIAAVSEAGILSGNNGDFMPDEYLTRAQLAVILVQAFDLKGSSNSSFTDVPSNHWAKEHINILAHNKVTSGYGNGQFGTNDFVTKDQFKNFLNRLK